MGGYYPIPIPQGYPLYGQGFGPFGAQPGAGIQQSSMGFDVSGPMVNVNPNAPMENIFAQNRNVISDVGNQIGNEGASQFGYYGPLQQQYQAATATALNNLGQTPGFNPQEAAQIGADFSQFNTPQSQLNQQFLTPDEQSQISGNPYQSVNSLQGGLGAEGAFLNQYQADLGSQLGEYEKNLGGAAQGFESGVGGAARGLQQGVQTSLEAYNQGLGSAIGETGQGIQGAVSGLRGGLDAAQGKFAGLDQAVYNPSLGFDPNRTEKQMTDQDVQNIRTQAGVAVGNQFQTAEDTLERQAAQAGNTSPAALAAMRQRLVTQEGATAGDVESQAQIQALQAQYERAAGIEGQRLGAAQTQMGMRAAASTTEEAAAQAAAGQAGMAGLQGQQFLGGQRLQGAEALGQAGLSGNLAAGEAGLGAQEAIGGNWMNAANLAGQANIQGVTGYGQFSTGEANTMTGQQYNALSTAEILAQQRAAALAANRQATQTGVNQTQYQQGVGSQQLSSQGQQALGGARMAGQNTYLSGVANQQAQAQQGGQAAQQTQLGAFGTMTSGLNSATSGQANFEVGKPSLGDQLGKSLAGLFEKGGIATEPTIAKLGEHGPEMVIPLYRRKQERMAA